MAGSSTEIGSAAVVLTASADGLLAGFQKAEKDVQGFATRVGNSLTGAFQDKGLLGGVQKIGGAVSQKLAGVADSAKGLLTKAGSGIGFALGGPIGAAIGSVVGGAVGDLGVTIAGAIGAPFEKLDELGGIKKAADVLGVSASQFQGLTKILGRAGIEGEQVSAVFATMGKNIADASQGHGKAFPALQALGIDAKGLMALPIDEQFKAIADSISKLPPGAQQASAALHIFGGTGAALLPQLAKGGQGIQDFIDQQKKLGGVLSDSQIEAAANASKAWKGAKSSIAAAWDGLVNRATLIAAPVIEFAGKAVSKAFSLATPVFDWLGRALGQVADIATAVFEQLTVWFEQGVEWVKSWAAELGTFTGGWPTVQEVVVAVFRAIGTAAAILWDNFKVGAGIWAIVAGTFVENGVTILGVFRELVDLLKKIPDRFRPSWADGFIRGVDHADDRLRAFGTNMKAWGRNAIASWGQSARDFNSWLDRALKPKEKPKASGAAGNGPVAVTQAEPAKLAGAIEAGTKEAYTLQVRNQMAGEAAKEDLAKQQLTEQQKQNRNLEKLGEKIDKLGDKWGVL